MLSIAFSFVHFLSELDSAGNVNALFCREVGIFCAASLSKSSYHTLDWAFRCAFCNPTRGNIFQLVFKWGSFSSL